MADILNLALKKDVFEGIMKGTSNEIPIESSKWWTKRLKDEDTGRFKPFKIARVSSGSPEKYDFPIENISLRGKYYIVVISANKGMESESEPDAELLEPMGANPVEVNDDGTMTMVSVIPKTKEDIQRMVDMFAKEMTPVEDEVPGITEVTRKEAEKKADIETRYQNEMSNVIVPDIKERMNTLLDEYCKKDKVFSISGMDKVTILTNGRVLGCDKKAFTGRMDNNVFIPFSTETYIKYKNMSDDEYIKIISDRLEKLREDNFVFIRKSKCGFTKIASGEDELILTITARKIYAIKRSLR